MLRIFLLDNMKRIVLSLLMVCCLIDYGTSQVRDTTVHILPEIHPTFKFENCTTTDESVKEYFLTNFKMPLVLQDNCFVGKVWVQFVVEKDSSISNVKVIRGIDKRLDTLVLRTVKSMPQWCPGSNNGKTVRCQFILPTDIKWLYGKIEEDE